MQIDAKAALLRLRAAGWSVAVHNDYRLDDMPFTFWLFTRRVTDGPLMWAVRGEGGTDNEALDHVIAQALCPDCSGIGGTHYEDSDGTVKGEECDTCFGSGLGPAGEDEPLGSRPTPGLLGAAGRALDATATPEGALFYVQCTAEVVGNCILWWGANHSGYTTDLRMAGKYTAAECKTMRPIDVPWPVEYIDAHTVAHVRADAEATARGKDHPVAAAAFRATRR